ncbi:MAG: transketolase [Verrucomicrobia bacterium]|jgi:transketolase|nr:transketolase [Verrucomicrobiota bacterium]MBT7069184.1 transketolase [Verrucomicrobiota bacterium]MBT7699618.1 transketolase [Verrucomicrobiota bacterium]
MRQAFLKELTRSMEQDPSVYLLVGDTGFHVFDDFQETFRDRYLNTGLCEAAMVGMAAGLAVAGKRVFVYGIAPFVTFRCFEQIRVDLCYANLPVTIVGVGAGLTYGPAGVTHHTIEDVAVLSALPNMTVVCPGDPVEAGAATREIMSLPGPCYLRLGKSGEPVVHQDEPADFRIGRGIRLREGRGVALIASGSMLPTAVAAAEILAESGLEPEVISMHTVKPLDEELVLDVARRCGTIATIEEHVARGGLGSAVGDTILAAGAGVRMLRFALPDAYACEAGSQAYLRAAYGLTAGDIAGRILNHG